MKRHFIQFLLCLIFCIFSSFNMFKSAPYQQVTLKLWDGLNGYLDKEIAPGVFIVEVTQIGGYVHDMEVLKAHWLRRANELCPNGYTGSFEVILPCQAKLKELRRNRKGLQQYPMVSGIIRTKN